MSTNDQNIENIFKLPLRLFNFLHEFRIMEILKFTSSFHRMEIGII